MKTFHFGLAMLLSGAVALPAHADIRITEVAPWSSGSSNSPLGADWFELTNTGTSSVDITGWKMDDSSASFASAVALVGISSIAAGESVIFIESSSDLGASFRDLWFGVGTPAGLQFGHYSGSGVGLSTGGDGVNIFNAAGIIQASVSFGTSPTSPFPTFDNAAGLNNAAISTLSVVGTSGAFAAIGDANEIGSPGAIAAVPEPETYAMMLAGLGLIGLAARKGRHGDRRIQA